MTTYFITRHQGAQDWAYSQGITAQIMPHLDPDMITKGDIVMGTLPIPIIAEICAKGARYFHLTLPIPPELRGKELSAQDMQNLGAKLEEFTARKTNNV